MSDFTFAMLRQKAAAYKELHGTSREVYLNDENPPWHLATGCESGGSHRLDISTSVWFSGFDPETGLKLRWSFDIEPHSANGSGTYQIDATACRSVMSKLQCEARAQFRTYLKECSEKVRARGEEYRKAADRQMTDAAVLSDLASA